MVKNLTFNVKYNYKVRSRKISSFYASKLLILRLLLVWLSRILTLIKFLKYSWILQLLKNPFSPIIMSVRFKNIFQNLTGVRIFGSVKRQRSGFDPQWLFTNFYKIFNSPKSWETNLKFEFYKKTRKIFLTFPIIIRATTANHSIIIMIDWI